MQFCQRVEYEVADCIYETRNSLVEICREEPASSIVIFDKVVPFYQTTRRHFPEDSSAHSRRCENLKSLNPVRFVFRNTAELHLTWTLVIRTANYPDRLGPSGIFVENSTKLTCLEVSGILGWGVGVQTPFPQKFRSFDKVEPDCKLSGKCLVFLFQHPN
jgi:hypothetical protein